MGASAPKQSRLCGVAEMLRFRCARNDRPTRRLRHQLLQRPHRRHIGDPVDARRTEMALERGHDLVRRRVVAAAHRDAVAVVGEQPLQRRDLLAVIARAQRGAVLDRLGLDPQPDAGLGEAAPGETPRPDRACGRARRRNGRARGAARSTSAPRCRGTARSRRAICASGNSGQPKSWPWLPISMPIERELMSVVPSQDEAPA